MSVHWFLSGNKEKPSSRIHGFRLHEALISKNISSYIDYCPIKSSIVDLPFDKVQIKEYVKFLKPREIVIIQKLHGPNTIEFLDQLNEKEINSVYIDCDVPCKINEAKKVSWVVASSEYLSQEYKKLGIKNVLCIEDAAEVFIKPHFNSSEMIKCVWFGLPGKQKWDSVVLLKNEINKASNTVGLNCSLLTISSNREADIKWSRNSFSLINTFDIAVIPVFFDNKEAFSKSSNRVIQSMALGLPVLASPIPSYSKVIEDGLNGYICNNLDDWINKLKYIQDTRTLFQMKQNSFEFAQKKYSINKIIEDWKSLFYKLGGVGPNNNLTRIFMDKYVLRRLFEKLIGK